MEKVELIEKTPEWFQFRAEHRTASESPTVMGVNPYMTSRELWELKNGMGESFTGNVATEFGVRNEPIARAIASRELGVSLDNAVFVDGEYSASLDAYGVDDKGLTYKVEIKCVYAGLKAKRWQAALEQEIMTHDYYQLTHQEMVCPTDSSYLMIFVDQDTWRLIPYVMNQGDDQVLRDAWDMFYANPPAPRYVERKDLIGLADHYSFLKRELDSAKANFAKVEKELKAAVDQDTQIGDLKISQTTRKGNVDYAKIKELKGMDLE